MASTIRDNPARSRFEMSLGYGALAVASKTVASPCSTRRCRKSCPAWGTDHDWHVVFSKRCNATGKE